MSARTFLLAGVSFISFATAAGSAGAADLPARPPTLPTVPAWSWTGFYVGTHLGSAWDRADWLRGDGPFATVQRFEGYGTSGGTFTGLQAGYDYQAGSWVLGVAIEGSLADLDGNARCYMGNALCNTRIDGMATATGRLGWAFGNTLVYGKAGGAYAHAKHIVTAYNTPETLEGSAHRYGWTVGAGLAYAVSPLWSVKLEYDYLHLGSDTATVTDYDVRREVTTDQQIHRIKLGIDRRIDWDLPGLIPGLPATTAAAAIPVKAAPSSGPLWTIEAGTRVWLSNGRFQRDLMSNVDPSRLNSRLGYNDMTGIAGEAFGRFDHRDGLFVKGNLGAGTLTNGTLRDEDFPGEAAYSNTVSDMRNSRMRYGGVDVGYNFLVSPLGQLGAYVGYRYFSERGNGYGCAQLAGDPMVCSPAFSTVYLGLSNTETWRGVAVGLNSRLKLTERIRLEVDGAVLPYASANGFDNHWYRPDINPQPESGAGWGGQVEAILSYALTPQWSVGIGGRYWYYTTTNARTEFPGHVPDSPMKFAAERWGGFLQTSYTFDSRGTEVAVPSSGGLFKAPRAAAAPRYDWTGVHLGGHIGAAWGRTEWSVATGTGREAWNDVDGFLAGGQIGADYQIGQWVLGLEGSYSWSDLDGNAPCHSDYTCHVRADGLGTVTGRLGWAFGNVLLYSKAGAAWLSTNEQMAYYRHVGGTYAGDATRTGWTLGSGLEYGFAPNWSARVEYNWADFGTKSVAMTDQLGNVVPVDLKQTVQDVRLGVNYRFGPAGAVPVAAPFGFPVAGLFATGPRVDWSGAHLGVQVGGGHAGEDWSNPFGPQISGDRIGGGGWLAGGQVGYDQQIGAVVLGVEADASAVRFDSTDTCFVGLDPLIGGVNCRSQIEALATLTGRAGWAVDRSLIYVKGGGALARERRELNLVSFTSITYEATTTRSGWTLGAGIEHAILPNVSVKLEYDYVSLGSAAASFGVRPDYAVVDNRSVTQDAHIAKLGVNYRFNTIAPVPVKAKD